MADTQAQTVLESATRCQALAGSELPEKYKGEGTYLQPNIKFVLSDAGAVAPEMLVKTTECVKHFEYSQHRTWLLINKPSGIVNVVMGLKHRKVPGKEQY